jgi:hypothetical protein
MLFQEANVTGLHPPDINAAATDAVSVTEERERERDREKRKRDREREIERECVCMDAVWSGEEAEPASRSRS